MTDQQALPTQETDTVAAAIAEACRCKPTDAIRVDDHTPQLSSSPTIGKLAIALAKAQAKITQPRKGTDNAFFKSKYADLSEVWNAARLALSAEGIAVVQAPSFSTGVIKDKLVGMICVSTTVIHGESGEWMTNVLRVTSENIGPQAIGSAISYARRYSIQPMLGLTPDDGSDDDAEKAEGRVPPAVDKPTSDQVTSYTASINGAASVDALKAAYNAIPEAYKKSFNKLVGARKAMLEKAAAAETPAIHPAPLGPPLTNKDEATA